MATARLARLSREAGRFCFGAGNAETELRRHADSSRFMQRNIRKFIAITLLF
ncbi:hypothetical protein [Burkholderia ubonensis]|uniref:hypothetical protein n=1 Tax=Burkholderia ubonensis TaxID=101571 RepID=UPI0002DBAC2B|nr:hypothetical protein [Burkholderia ubonensis]